MGRHNPFNPNSVVSPTLFAGRTEQLLQILKKLAQVKNRMPANFVLHGERGIGKTALAKLIMHVSQARNPKLENLRFLTSYYAVERGQHFSSILQASLNSLTDRLPSKAITRLTERLGDFFKGGKFSFGAFGVNLGIETARTTQKNKERGKDTEQFLKDQAVSALTNILTALRESDATEDCYDGLLIVIDEVQNLQDLSGIAQVLRSISTTLDVAQVGNVSFMIIGYSDAIAEFFEGDPSAKRSFDSIHLTYMPHDEAKEILIKGFEDAEVSFDENVLDQEITSAGGYPHSIQILGHNLIEADNDSIISQDDWQRALKMTALELQTKDFSNFYNFNKKETLREELLNVLAYFGVPIAKNYLGGVFREAGKNIYGKTCLPELKEIGAVKENPITGDLSLHSGLFRTAILLNTNKDDSKWINIAKSVAAKMLPAPRRQLSEPRVLEKQN